MLEALFGVYLFFFGGLLTYWHNTDSQNITDEASLKVLKRIRRVVGGEAADIADVPYLVNIRRDGFFECGGSLVTPSCILTAAHCIKDGQPESFVVRAGLTYLTEKQNSRRVERIFLPTDFSNKTLDYDVAIFKLRSDFDNTPTIELADVNFRLMSNTMIRISGWGLTSESAKTPSNRIRSAEVRTMAHDECVRLYRDYRNVTQRMFCASIPGQRDACSADSGGPAVFRNKLVGIVSWGKGYECARAESPGVYVNVAKMRPWIDAVLEKEC